MSYQTRFCVKSFFFFMLFFPFYGFSAGILLTPDNIGEVVALLEYRHGDDILISSTKLKNFLDETIDGAISMNLSTPNPAIDEVNDDKISFTWTAIPNATEYTTKVLNLKTGITNSKTQASSSVNFTLANDLYLFSFQSITDVEKGLAWIIIEDKPLTLVNSLNFGSTIKDCDCLETDYVSTPSIGLDYEEVIPYPAGNFEEVYVINLSYPTTNDPSLSAHFAMELEGANGAIENVYIMERRCLSNIHTDYSYLYALDLEGSNSANDSYAISFSFGMGGVFVQSLDTVYDATIEIIKCENFKSSGGGRRTSRLSPQNNQLFPNPTTGPVHLKIADQEKYFNATGVLKNAMGKTILSIDATTTTAPLLDLGAYPNGVYYLHLIGDPFHEVYPIIKTE